MTDSKIRLTKCDKIMQKEGNHKKEHLNYSITSN
jgi:hypothetical protein